MRSLDLCLRFLRFRLLETVRHPHLTVHRRRGSEMLLRLLPVARAPAELAEAEVAVGDKGAPAEFGGERHRLTVVGLGGLNLLVCIERQRNGAENVKHIRFRASLLLSPSEIACSNRSRSILAKTVRLTLIFVMEPSGAIRSR